MKLLHVAVGAADNRIWSAPFRAELAGVGEFELVEHGASLDEDACLARLRQADVLLGSWGVRPVPAALAAEPGRVRYLCCVTGSVRGFVSAAHIEAGIPVTNWGDVPACEIAEGAVTLLLATLKGLHANIVSVRNGGGSDTPGRTGGSLRGLKLGIYGFGVIGRRFAELLRPFGCAMRVFDPFVTDFPDHVTPVGSLKELFADAEAVAIHAGLTAATRNTVTAELLAMLPRHGIVINTARGDIIDQAALFAELASGRLRAGLDVLAEPDRLPPDHPARQWENLVWTCHDIGRAWPDDGRPPPRLLPMHEVCLDNLRRFRDGQPLRFLVDLPRFARST